MKTTKTHRDLQLHRIPCGPMSINAHAVCRRRLHDTFDRLLDRLCEDCHEWQEPEIPEGHELTEDGRVMSSEHLKKQEKAAEKAEKKAAEPTPAEKKKQMIEEGKMKVDVKKEVKAYEEKVMGNSKLGQDISGKIKKR